VLWQLPPRMPFDPARLEPFLAMLPRSTAAAAELAAHHDERLAGRVHLEVDDDRPLRHALEVRHPTFCRPEFVELLREQGVALVVADTAGMWPHLEDVTADFVYVRLHGDTELYTSGYTAEALDAWAAKVRAWRDGRAPTGEFTVAPPADEAPGGRDVFVYFDNDVKVHAPYDAIALMQRLAE
jgi:uncharacterized protein YecE (DUF72 family)